MIILFSAAKMKIVEASKYHVFIFRISSSGRLEPDMYCHQIRKSDLLQQKDAKP